MILFSSALNVITGAHPKAGTGHKMKTVSVFFFQRYIVKDISLTEIYRWLIEILSAIWKARDMEDSQDKGYSFLGNDTFPNLYDALVLWAKI